MSIFGSMQTAVSGMNAQANKLSTVSDNISNSSTTGYKTVTASFSSLVIPSSGGNYQSGSVSMTATQNVTEQGDTTSTTTPTNLALQGNGFFMVQSPSGQYLLTRAGDFSPDENGNLVNSAGMTLMAKAADDTSSLNGFSGLVPVNVSSANIGLTAEASTSGTLSGNLPSGQTVYDSSTDGDLPSANTANVTSDTIKTSVVGYDSKGTAITYDVYFTKTQKEDTTSGTTDQWEMSVYRADQAATGGTSSFPYTDSDGNTVSPIATQTVEFGSDGKLSTGGTLDLDDTTSGTTISLNLSKVTQLSSSSSLTGKMDGHAASAVESVSIGTDGTVSAVYADSSTSALYKIPLATVTSPDNMTLVSGNAYQQTTNSGTMTTGYANTTDFGSMKSSAVEASTVDLASQLTDMIQASKSYSANSKVFQTGSDLMDVINNLVR